MIGPHDETSALPPPHLPGESEEQRADRWFGQIAVGRRYITSTALEECLQEQRRDPGLRIGQILMRKGHLSSEQFLSILAVQNRKPPAPPASPPETIGRYRIRREIARGGMGIVYEAQDAELQRRVALKILRDSDAEPDVIRRLQIEGTIMAQLQHPNIVGVHEVGVVRDAAGRAAHYIAMDFVEGTTLADLLARGTTPRAELLRILEETARAAAYAHEKGVVHRDLKPANVLVDPSGRAVLTDFGLARAESLAARLTRSQSVLGTPHYMSPEQVEGRTREIDARTDVYALGVLLYEILTGRVPFNADTPAALYRQILQDEPANPSRIARSVEPDLEVICLKAMSKERFRRYAGAAGFAEELARFRRGEPIHARPPSFLYLFRKRLSRRKGLLATAVVATLLAGIGTAIAGIAVARGRRFDDARKEAEGAYAAGQWERAAAAAERAIRIRADEAVSRMLADSERRIAQAKDDAERYRRFQEETVKPLLGKLKETRPFFYIDHIDIRAKLSELESSLDPLRIALQDPRIAKVPDGWKLLGIAWSLLGADTLAEEALLRAAPDDGEVRIALARMYLQRSTAALWGTRDLPQDQRLARAKRWSDEALKWLSRDLGAGVEPIDRQIAAVCRALAENEPDEAARLCREGLERFPNELGTEEFWLFLALRYRGDDGIQCCRRAIQIRPHYPWARFFRAIFRIHKGEDEAAIEDLSQAVRVNRRFAQAYAVRGQRLAANRRLREAHEDLDQAVALEPEIPEFHFMRGDIRGGRGDRVGAIADLTEAIRIYPAYASAHLSRGLQRLEMGKPSDAIADMGEAIRLRPDWAMALRCRGQARMRTNDLPGALEDLEAAVRHAPDDAESRFVRGNVLWKLKEPDRAAADFTEAVRLDPKHFMAYNQRGIVRLDQGRTDDAIADFSEAIRLQPDQPQAYFNRAQARDKRGDREEAKRDCGSALKVAPADWPYRRVVEQLLRSLQP